MLKDYQTGQNFAEFLAVVKSTVGTAKNNKPYLDLRLSDGETQLSAKQWDYTGDAPKENTVIAVKATMESYQGTPQLVVEKWRPSEPGEVDPSKFIGKSPYLITAMWTELQAFLGLIKNQNLASLVDRILENNIDKFTSCPAAMGHHHNYIGGLLEHTLGVLKYALAIAPDNCNKDLLIAGAILHDFGKIDEYDWSGCTITLKPTGKLLGHIAIGYGTVNHYWSQDQSLDLDTLNGLLHLILSHHGKLEWGSPVEPKMKEAFVLHQADMMDANLWKINKAEHDAGEEQWTAKISGIGREFYVLRCNDEKR